MYSDRSEAGQLLAQRLAHLEGADIVVVGLPRGGVPVAYEVAKRLGAPLDVIVVRKIGVPWQPELAMGAVGENGVVVVDSAIIRAVDVDEAEFTAAERLARAELGRKRELIRRARPRVPLIGRTVVVVDDGIATGATARAACQVARAHGAERVVLATPVGSPRAVEDVSAVADEVVCPLQPLEFRAVGEWYENFDQTSDEDMLALLAAAAAEAAGYRGEIEFSAGSSVRLPGWLTVPAGATGVVIFAHGAGSNRTSPRNLAVADLLNRAGLGTLVFDLLVPHEAQDRRAVFDIRLLAVRLGVAIDVLRSRDECANARLGLFGASTGAAAALWAAAERPDDVAAVVSRGGRPDLAGERLPQVKAPTLLIVGSEDEHVLDLNRVAQQQLRCPHRLEVIPGAGHLFEEPGTLRAAAECARAWFVEYLTP